MHYVIKGRMRGFCAHTVTASSDMWQVTYSPTKSFAGYAGCHFFSTHSVENDF